MTELESAASAARAARKARMQAVAKGAAVACSARTEAVRANQANQTKPTSAAKLKPVLKAEAPPPLPTKDELAACFPTLRAPFAIGIREEMLARIRAKFPLNGWRRLNKRLGSWLAELTKEPEYLSTLKEGVDRYDMDGRPAGKVTAEHAAQKRQFHESESVANGGSKPVIMTR